MSTQTRRHRFEHVIVVACLASASFVACRLETADGSDPGTGSSTSSGGSSTSTSSGGSSSTSSGGSSTSSGGSSGGSSSGEPDAGESDAGGGDGGSGSSSSGVPIVPIGPLDPAAVCLKMFGGDYVESPDAVVVDGKGNITVIVNIRQPTAVLAIPPIGTAVDYGGGAVPATDLTRHLVSFDSQCNHRWSRATDGRAMAVGPLGEIWTADTGAGRTGALRKHDPATGAELVAKTIPINARLAIDKDGNIVLGGLLNGTAYDFGGGPLAPASNGFFVVELDPSGAFRWQRVVSWNGATSGAMNVRAAPNGDVVVGGQHAGVFDLGGAGAPLPGPAFGEVNGFWMRFASATGAILSGKGWSPPHGYNATTNGFSVDGTGDIYAASYRLPVGTTGCNPSSSVGCTSFARFDASGTLMWSTIPNGSPGLVYGSFGNAVGATFVLSTGKIVKVGPSGPPLTAAVPPQLAIDYRLSETDLPGAAQSSTYINDVAGAPDGRVVLVGRICGRLSAPLHGTLTSRTGTGNPPPVAADMFLFQLP